MSADRWDRVNLALSVALVACNAWLAYRYFWRGDAFGWVWMGFAVVWAMVSGARVSQIWGTR